MRPQHDTHRVPTVALAPLIQAWIVDHLASHPSVDESVGPDVGSNGWANSVRLQFGPMQAFAALVPGLSLRNLNRILSGETGTVGFCLADEIVCKGLRNPWLWHGELAEWYWPAQTELAAA